MWKTRPIGKACLVSTLSSKANKLNRSLLDVIYGRVDKVEDSQRTKDLNKIYSNGPG